MYCSSNDRKKDEILIGMDKKVFENHISGLFPDLFYFLKNRGTETFSYPINYGIDIGPGWRSILVSLCEEFSLLNRSFANCNIKFVQIKEKFAMPCFYYVTDSHIDDILKRVANSISNHYTNVGINVCDETGKYISAKEKITIGGWRYACGIEGFKTKLKRMRDDDYDDTEMMKIAQENIDKNKA
jgi:hypothetical protein